MSSNIHARMAAIQAAVTGVSKDTEVKFRAGSYKGVSHDAVVVAVRTAALENGVLITPSVTNWEDMGQRFNVEVTTRFSNIEDPSDYIEVVSVGQGMDTQDKSSGKAISYAKKYGLLLAFQLETRDGDELRPEKDFEPDLDFLKELIANSTKTEEQVLKSLRIDDLAKIDKTGFARIVRQLSPKK